MPLRPVSLRLLPLAVVAIVVATAIPVAQRAPVTTLGAFDFGDFVANLILFAPLGIALRRQSVWLILIIAATLSAVIEISQIWSVDRVASLYDVVANTSGALVAALMSRPVERRGLLSGKEILVGPGVLVALLFLAAAVIVIWQLPHPSSAVAGWDSNYPLQLGNERTGDREWHGTIAALGIWPKAITPRELARTYPKVDRASTGSARTALFFVRGEPVEPRISNVEISSSKRSGKVPASGAVYVTHQPLVFTGGPPVRLSDETARAFVAAATRANAFTIAARINPADIEQNGPARFLSFSIDPYHRNVDFGQERSRLVFRVRTDVSGPNGNDYYARSVPILKAGEDTDILASYDGAIARIYANGTLVARKNLAASGCSWPTLCDVDTPGVWASLAAIVTLVGISLFGWRSRPALWLTVALAVGVVLAMGALHPDPVHLPWERWAPLYALLGAATIALSVLPPLQAQE